MQTFISCENNSLMKLYSTPFTPGEWNPATDTRVVGQGCHTLNTHTSLSFCCSHRSLDAQVLCTASSAERQKWPDAWVLPSSYSLLCLEQRGGNSCRNQSDTWLPRSWPASPGTGEIKPGTRRHQLLINTSLWRKPLLQTARATVAATGHTWLLNLNQ